MRMVNNVIAIGFALLCIGCNTHERPIPETVADDMPSYQDFVASHTFPYVAPPQRQTQVKHNYPRLTVGLTKQQVVTILGQPDFSQRSRGKTVSRGYTGSSWTYYLEKPHPSLTNLKKDISVKIFFDINGKTHWITSSVLGLNEIGNPQKPDNRQDN